MNRVYLVVRHKKKKEPFVIVLQAYQDKHKAKAKADELDIDKKKDWHTIEKFDVVDCEDDLPGTGDSATSTK